MSPDRGQRPSVPRPVSTALDRFILTAIDCIRNRVWPDRPIRSLAVVEPLCKDGGGPSCFTCSVKTPTSPDPGPTGAVRPLPPADSADRRDLIVRIGNLVTSGTGGIGRTPALVGAVG